MSFLEPELDNTNSQYKITGLSKIFSKYQKFQMDSSYYNFKYKNIYNDTIVLVLCKVKYSGEITSKYILAYDSEILESSDIIKIISNIFVK